MDDIAFWMDVFGFWLARSIADAAAFARAQERQCEGALPGDGGRIIRMPLLSTRLVAGRTPIVDQPAPTLLAAPSSAAE